MMVSLIRTIVPVLVASGLTWLSVRSGLVLDEDTSAQVVVAVTGAAVTLYYGIVRLLEQRYPWFGVLLGSRKQPTYAKDGEK